MIDVKEANEATAQVREKVRKSWGTQEAPFRINVPIESDTFRDSAEMVTLSANRFERLIRQNEDLQHRLTSCENLLNAISSFIDQEAMEYAKKGRELPSWEDVYKMAEIIHWTEPASVRFVRIEAEQKAQEAQEAERIAKNAQEAERLAKHLQEVKDNGEATD